ncbi:GTPase HflX [Fusibacter paucivorans]|uniref:GTPase HflX n=1 Tax=Fusibacter paucivorans TaxID=76009 RepID=A0ABS5PVI9_9FIRM|nr:GTPase HflX [Fusibacter paucivorans]MBS7528544.1 GTPase HflX [Fusibacter paucivorans]
MDSGQLSIQRAVLVGLSLGVKDTVDIESSMQELAELARAAGAEVVDSLIQNKASVEATTFIGTGKVEEVRIAVLAYDANLVIFNDELSGAQIRNLEGMLDVKVIDRTALILDIFAVRAQTKIAKLQVELAQLRYRLPRLTGLGKSMSRTGGGIGTRGPGEQKLEIDRRRIQERIDDIRRQIKETEKNRTVQRQLREKNGIPIVALVGYTNAGKSSIMNRFIEISEVGEMEKQVFEKDMLFATLDTYNRRIVLTDKKEFVLTDTVGFVSKLPHSLVDAFKATLEEALSADLLLHVVDASDAHYEMQMTVTHQVLRELKAHEKTQLTLFNKIDKLDILPQRGDNQVFYISAKTGTGFEALIEAIKKQLFKDMVPVNFVIPYSEGGIASYLCETYEVDALDYTETGTSIKTTVNQADYHRYAQYLVSDRINEGDDDEKL